METPTLRIILENCFSPGQLEKLLPNASPVSNIVDEACEAILSEDEDGMAIADRLDRESKSQRAKIQSMKARELRSGVAFEFLEPGRMLGLILWALLRDPRLSARSLANVLAERFSRDDTGEPALPIDDSEDLDNFDDLSESDDFSYLEEDTEDVTIDEELAQMAESLDTAIGLEEEPDEDDLDLDDLLSGIGVEDTDEFPIEEPAPVVETDEEFDVPDEIFDNETVSEDVDSLIATLHANENEPDLDEPSLDDLDLELEEGIETTFLDEDLEDEDFDETGDDMEEIEIEAPMIFDEDLMEDDLGEEPSGDSDEDIEQVEELIEDLQKHHIWTPDFDLGEPMEEEIDTETIEESPEIEEQLLPGEPLKPAGLSISLGGVEISLASLKRACESVFNEPVELVTDENLTRQDKIVVVGKQCGVRVLRGPRYTLQPYEKPLTDSGDPIIISPESLQNALSRIYDERIELVPDPILLDKGTIVFAGKDTGLSLMTNPRTKIPLPEWVEKTIQEKTDLEELIAGLSELRQYAKTLEDKITVLEQAPPPAPVVQPAVLTLPKPKPKPKPKPVPVPEPEEEEEIIVDVPPELEDVIADEPIAIEEIETEELEPVHDMSFDEFTGEDEHDDEIMAAIAAQEALAEDTSELEQAIEDISLDETEEEDSLDSLLEDEDLTDLDLDEDSEEPSTIPSRDSLTLEELGDLDEMTDGLLEGLGEEIAEDEEETGGVDLEDMLGEEETGDVDLESMLGDVDTGEEELDLDSIGLDEEIGDESEEVGEEELDLDALDLGEEGDIGDEIDTSLLEGFEEEEEEEVEDDLDISPALPIEELDLDILSELDMEEPRKNSAQQVFSGEQILLLGGDAKHEREYSRIMAELGGTGEYYTSLSEITEGEIAEIVDRADLIITLTAKAVSDPGIVQASNYARETGKPLYEFHSANPKSVQKQLTKIAREG